MRLNNCNDNRGNYVIVDIHEGCNIIGHQIKMIQNNCIDSILPIELRQTDNIIKVYYNIGSKKRLLDCDNISIKQYKAILLNTLKTIINCQKYFLSENRFNIAPENIYVSVDMKPNLIYIPISNNDYDIYKQVKTLVEFLLTKVDTDDKKAVLISHDAFKVVQGENYNLNQLYDLINNYGECEEDNVKQDNVVNVLKQSKPRSNNDEKKRPKAERIKNQKNNKVKVGKIKYQNTGMSIGKRLSELYGRFNDKYCLAILLIQIAMIIVVGLLITIGVSQNMDVATILGLLIILSVVDIIIIRRIKGYTKTNVQSSKDEELITEGLTNADETMMLTSEIDEVPYLISSSDSEAKHIEICKSPFVIGKMDKYVDLTINNNTVSRVHAEIIREEDEYYVRDINSKNGTFIEDDRLDINKKYKIDDGSMIAFSDTSYVFHRG